MAPPPPSPSPFPFVVIVFVIVFFSLPLVSLCKSTIEPCSVSDACPALLGYTLYADLKVSEVAALFRADPFALLAANALDFASVPDVPDRILPAGLFLRVPTLCSCADGIRKSLSTRYRTRPADTDNFLPAVYLSYVVRGGDTVPAIAARYSTTVADIVNANGMGGTAVGPGDILAIPLPACPSMFPRYASDYGMLVANATYAITADQCVQCSCGPGNLNLYCTPASLAVSCPSMQCRNSKLMLGNATIQHTSAGCNVTSCDYGGFVNGTLITKLTTTLQPKCPAPHQLPPVFEPPTSVIRESYLAPTPSPIPEAEPGGPVPSRKPSPSVAGTFTLPGVSPSVGPAGSSSEGTSVDRMSYILNLLLFLLLLIFSRAEQDINLYVEINYWEMSCV
ncbi:lysM domain-containing GPI-anchored protein 1 [Ananas comosus]|uniref:LysM domain-containing GPI-anchored protein 1 n=1 Tax=Ananas comosus TaxID=4615 RepID=A0A6P5FC06_ANACO|nr:lysM domain-containing GPI-anchored protein 1 [Ananas comosus]